MFYDQTGLIKVFLKDVLIFLYYSYSTGDDVGTLVGTNEYLALII